MARVSASPLTAHGAPMLSVEVTGRCDRTCPHCYNAWALDRSGPQPVGRHVGLPLQPATPPGLPADALVALVRDVLRQSGLSAVQITGGEPTLRDDLPALLEGLRPHVRGLSMVTDGARLDAAWVARLKRLKVGPVQPTLLAADRAVHDRLKGAPCFDATVDALARLVAAGVPTSVAFVCTRETAPHFHDVLELCFALGVRSVAFARLCTAGAAVGHGPDLAPTREQLDACLASADRAVARLGMHVHVAVSLPLCAAPPARYPHLTFGRCAVSAGAPGFTLDPHGRLRACSISPTVLGDLTREPWSAVMARARTGYLARMAEIPPPCRSCVDVSRCGGGCRESALAAFGDLAHADPLADL